MAEKNKETQTKASKAKLKKEVATASTTGIRQAYDSSIVARTLTPNRLATLIDSANIGNADDLLRLAEEMEEQEAHYAGVLGTRKRAVSSLSYSINAVSEEKKDQELAIEIKELCTNPAFFNLLEQLLDALGKGYAVSEIIWELNEEKWKPVDYKYRPQRFFTYDEQTGRELLLIDEVNINGTSLPKYKFIIFEPQLKQGLPIRGGLAKLVAKYVMCKAYVLTDWMAFVDLFGMPLRLGKYDNSATTEDKNSLKRAVANIGTDAAAIIPESMQIEFVDGMKNATKAPELFENLQRWLDEQISKAVLGQTMTSDNGSSQSQATVHNEVRLDIVTADSKQLAAVINDQLIKPYVDLNFGTQKNYPSFTFQIPKQEDVTTLTNALKELVPLGLTVDANEVRSKLGLSSPKEEASILQVPKESTTTQAQNKENKHIDCGHATILNQDLTDEVKNRQPETEIDKIGNELDEDWQSLQKPMLNAVNKIIEQTIKEGGDLKALKTNLETLPEELNKNGYEAKLAKNLAVQSFKARSEGDHDYNEERT